MTKNLAIGIDIGGSHISCAAIDLAAKQYLPETLAENTLNNHADADEIIGIWVKTIEEAIQKTNAAEIAGIGFAMPGPFDYDRGIALFDEGVQKYENLYGLNVAQAIRKQMNLPEDFPIRFITMLPRLPLPKIGSENLPGPAVRLPLPLARASVQLFFEIIYLWFQAMKFLRWGMFITFLLRMETPTTIFRPVAC